MNKLPKFLLLFILGAQAMAQVGIGTISPDVSTILDIQADDKGILIPRLTTGQRDAIVDPANGLLIFNTDSDEFQYNSNSPGTPIWQAFDNAPTSSSTIGQSVKYSNTDTTTDINPDTAINAPIIGTLNWNDNTTLYSVDTTNHEITIAETGRYQVVVNASVAVNGNRARLAPEMRIAVDGTPTGTYASTGYMRRNNGHEEASLHITEILELTAGETISVEILRAANTSDATIFATLRDAGSSNIYIEKLM